MRIELGMQKFLGFATGILLCLVTFATMLGVVINFAPESSVATPSVEPGNSDQAMIIAAQIEATATENPGNEHLLSATFPSGSIEIVMAIPPQEQWLEICPPCSPMKLEMEMAIDAAINRGAYQFQLMLIPSSDGVIVEK